VPTAAIIACDWFSGDAPRVANLRGKRAVHQPTDLTKFWDMMDRTAGPEACWPWLGYITAGTGYGSVQVERRPRGAHRVAWQLHNGRTLTSSELVCHSCDNRPCCNPAHLWVGTSQDNIRDMFAKGRANNAASRNAEKTHCPSGHAYDGTARRRNGSAFRVCSICSAEHKRAWKRRQRAKSKVGADRKPCREPKKGYARG
jgi:hypothetical protein